MTSAPRPQLKLPTMMLAFAIVVGTAVSVRAATATWDANNEADLAGYILSYGTQSGVHTVVIDVGRVTTYTFNPPPGRYYVVVQAYNTSGGISDKSAEVILDVPATGGGAPPPSGGGTPPPSGGSPPSGGGAPSVGVQPPFFFPPVSGGSPQPSPAPPVFQPSPAPPVPQGPTTPLVRLVQPSSQTSRVHTSVLLAVTASHVENRALTYSATGLPPGLSINSSSGVISGTPHATGFYRVLLTVSDGSSSVGGDFAWSIVDTLPAGTRPNQPPAMAQPNDLKTPLDRAVSFNVPTSDPEGRSLSFSASGLPPGLSIDPASGLVSGTPTTLGLYEVTIAASDGELSSAVNFRWAVVHLNMLDTASGEPTSSPTSSRQLETGGQDYLDVSGDFDGDGRNDLATYQQSTSEWRIWTSGSNFAKPIVMVWGAQGDRPVPADYNGDRVTDFAVYRPSTGTWHMSLSGTQTPLALQWGGADDVPVPLDHDGDGKADLGLIRGGGYEILLSGANYLKSVRVF